MNFGAGPAFGPLLMRGRLRRPFSSRSHPRPVAPRQIVIPIGSGTRDDAYAGLQQATVLYLAH